MEANNNSSSNKINLHDLPQFKFEDLTVRHISINFL